MSFFSRLLICDKTHFSFRSVVQLNARKHKINTISSRLVQTQEYLDDQTIKSIDDIPSPPGQPLLGHMGLMFKNVKSQHKFHEELRKQYGNIVLLSIPGTKVVCIYGPEEGKTMYANEGKYPVIGGFEVSEFFRFVFQATINIHFPII